MFANIFPGFVIAAITFSVCIFANEAIEKGVHQSAKDKHRRRDQLLAGMR
jgi:hypothetical protein